MRKYFLTLFCLVITSFVGAQDITALQKLPTEVKSSSVIIAEATINKGSHNQFLRYLQILPAGFSAEEIDCKGASFTFSADEGVKIIWMTPPPVESFVIKYKIIAPSQLPENLSVKTKMSYIDGNERKIFELPEHTFKTATVNVGFSEPITSTQVNVAKKEIAVKETAVPTSAVPASTGKTYKVQIGAFSAKPKIEGVPEITTLVLDNGITKYFSGNFTSYEDAVKRKALVAQKGFPGAFIVSFQDGKIVK